MNTIPISVSTKTQTQTKMNSIEESQTCPKCGEEMYARCEPDHEGGCYYDEEKLEDLIIGITAEIQQRGFDAGKHNLAWCDEAEEQFRELLALVSFEGKHKLYEKVSEQIKALDAEEEMPELIPISAQ